MSSIRPVASATFNKPRYWTHDQRLFAIAKLFKVQPQLGLTRSGNGRTRVLFLLLLLLPWGSAFKVMLCSVFNLVTFPIYTAAPRCLAEVNPALAGPAVLFRPATVAVAPLAATLFKWIPIWLPLDNGSVLPPSSRRDSGVPERSTEECVSESVNLIWSHTIDSFTGAGNPSAVHRPPTNRQTQPFLEQHCQTFLVASLKYIN